MHTNRKCEQLLRLRSFRYRQTPNYPKRVKAHAIRREPSTLLLIVLYEKFADFERTRFSGRFNVYVLFYISQPIGISSFKGYT